MNRWATTSAALLSPLLLWPQAIASRIDTLRLPFSDLTINEGLSQGMVQCIVQDEQGFLWFGTKDGLNRYDGYSFKVFRHDPADSTTVRESNISSLEVDRFGRLWVGTSIGVDLFDRNTERFTHLPIKHPKGDWGSVGHVRLDMNGDLWVATTDELVKLTFARPVEEGKPMPPFNQRWFDHGFSTVTPTRDGTLWGVSGSFAYRITPRHDSADPIDTLGRVNGVMDPDDLSGLVVVEDTLRGKLYGVLDDAIIEFSADRRTWTHLFALPRGQFWMQYDGPALDQQGRMWLATFAGLHRFDPHLGSMEIVRTSDPDLHDRISTVKWVTYDRGGTLWVGTSGYGLLKYDQRIERFNNFPDASIRALRPANDDKLIVARYDNFLNIFDPHSRRYIVQLATVGQLLPALDTLRATVNDMSVQDPEGYYWTSNSFGKLIRHRGTAGDVRLVPLPGDDGSMFPLMLGKHNDVWCAGDSALWRIDRRTLAATPFRWPFPTVNNPYTFVAAMHEDLDGIIWVGTMSGLLRLHPGSGGWQHWAHDPDDASSISFNVIFSICADPLDPGGVLWLGTNGGGLNRFDTRTGRVTRFSTKDGLPNDVVYGVLADDAGMLWMSTNKGISRFDPGRSTFRNFSVGDGLQSDEFNRHAFCKDAKGWLYFGGVNGFNYFDPQELAEDSTPVTVRITGIKIMNKPVTFGVEGSPLLRPVHLSEGMEIPYSSNMVTFTFAAMEFSAPELHQYRYMLDGFDPDWIDAGLDNSAIYTNLDPGTYTFRVRGRNRDGIWDERGSTFLLTVRPPWWMTWWFYALCGVVVIGGTWLYIRSLRKQREMLERTVATRTHELSRERDRSEELLKNILPANVAAELKHKGQAEARHFDRVTVLFSDFKEFTRVSEDLSPQELVEELNVCFNAFDRIMEKYGIEKIKTIGDAYMAAGGVPDPSAGMPVAVVHAALEMQDIMRQRKTERDAEGKPSFEMRVGIHTGPVVAGIVGMKKFQYDIWGDTVNIASRMETTGDPGEVNISSATFALVRNEKDLIFTPRGMVSAKGKGEMEMYYVRHASEHARAALAGQVEQAVAIASLVAETASPAERQSNTDGRSSPGALRNLKILLAEDNEFNAMVAQGQLENWVPGVRLDRAMNGLEAVERLKVGKYDVVLMDIQMPEMNGYDATQAIRALPDARSRIPIIAMSANVMKAEIDRCLEAGMNAFVPKPYKKEELMGALEKVLNGNDARR